MALNGRVDMSSFRAIVLLAVNDTDASEYAFNWYKDYIHRPEFFTVLLYCTEYDHHDIRDASPGRTAKVMKSMAVEIKNIEAKYGLLMEMNKIQGRIRPGPGKPGEAIVKAATEEGATMIVTGSRGLGMMKRAILGSVSDYVIHHSPVPVITCCQRT